VRVKRYKDSVGTEPSGDQASIRARLNPIFPKVLHLIHTEKQVTDLLHIPYNSKLDESPRIYIQPFPGGP
jgi:hypothetical protein